MHSPLFGSTKTETKLGRTCSKCHSFVFGKAKFCALDGTELKIDTDTPPPKDYVSCSYCGRLFPPGALYCASDGIRLYKFAPAHEAPREDWRPESVSESGRHIILNDQVSKSRATVELIGSVLDGRYRIETIIAQGGMAILYRAHQIGMDRTVAIKVMLPTFAPNSQAAERFAQECKLAARLNHPNIVAVHDVGMIGPQQPYLVMEYVDGVSLSHELSENGPPPLATALTIICQVLKGLEEAHGAGIIHRDLKPDNILLQRKSSDRSDWVKIVDFGIANLSDKSKRFTKTGSFIGTPAYMAPEQFRGKAIDTRVDIYAVGIVLFEILTGSVPFDGDSPDVVMMKHLIDEVPPLAELRPNLPAQVEVAMRKALAKEVAERFQTATEFRLALESCQKID